MADKTYLEPIINLMWTPEDEEVMAPLMSEICILSNCNPPPPHIRVPCHIDPPVIWLQPPNVCPGIMSN